MVLTMASYALQTPPRVTQTKPSGPKTKFLVKDHDFLSEPILGLRKQIYLTAFSGRLDTHITQQYICGNSTSNDKIILMPILQGFHNS